MKKIIVLSISSMLFGCATSYQSQGLGGGFSETQLDTNVFIVNFRGNGYTNPERANDLSLLRSAELALQNGFKYFVIVDNKQYTQNAAYTQPVTATTNINSNNYGSLNVYGNNATYNSNSYGTAKTTISGGQTYHISKPRASNTIVCFEDKPDGFSYSAEFLAKSLKEKYNIQNQPNK